MRGVPQTKDQRGSHRNRELGTRDVFNAKASFTVNRTEQGG